LNQIITSEAKLTVHNTNATDSQWIDIKTEEIYCLAFVLYINGQNVSI